ncbi:MAG: hypothetical protein ABIE36_00810 [Candidatus Diapherotrites archaeon]
MTDKKGIISALGKELEEVVKNPETDESTKSLIEKAMEFGYTVGCCESNHDAKNDPYSSFECIERYEKIKKLLRN